MIESMRDSRRTPVVSAVAGAVLLAGTVGFAVLLPKLDDGAEAATAADRAPVELPDRIGDDLVAVDTGTLPQQLAASFGDIDTLKKQEAAITDGLDDVFGVPGTFRVYASQDGAALAQVTVLDKAPGLFTPDALPIDPSVIGATRAAAELVRADGAVCSVSWPAAVPEGQQVDPDVKPQGVRCQLGEGERTYELTTQGLGVDQTVTLLKDVATA